MYPSNGLLTQTYGVDGDPLDIPPDPVPSDDCFNVHVPFPQILLITTHEPNTMNTGEDETSSGLNGRLRPRKSILSSTQIVKTTRRFRPDKTSQDKAKKTSTLSKISLNKTDDLANKSDILPTLQILCPYCDKKFALKQTASQHARRVHLSSLKQDFPINCLFCNHNETDCNGIIRHMVDSHPNQYFACLDCHTRFPSTTELAEHKLNVCEKQKPPYRSNLRKKVSGTKKNRRTLTVAKDDFPDDDKRFNDDHRFNGIVISCELKPAQVDYGDIEDNITTNLILPPSKNLGTTTVIEKNAVIVLDDIQWNKRMPPNFTFHNTDADQILSRLGVVHRSPRTGESTRRDWFKTVDDSSQKFERCFDTSFYSKVASNVQENLTKFLDGSFNFNPDPDITIKTRKSKNSVVINTADGFPILLACEQYSRCTFDGYMPRAIAPKHKWKWDNLESDKNIINAEQIKRDSHANNCIITLVSSLDISTQLRMRRKFEEKFSIVPTQKKTENQNVIGMELKEILESRELPTSSTQIVEYASTLKTNKEELDFPASLGLIPTVPKYDLPPAVLSGEWVRPRCYVCCACGAQTRDSKALSSHISTQHSNANVQYYEIVGEKLLNADIQKHLYVPPSQMCNRTRPLRGFRECTKCSKSISLKDLHQHMLDCAGDAPTVRRRCPRYRPFGVRRRRPRLPDNIIRKKMRKGIGTRQTHQKNHMRSRPRIRSEVGDAETIRKMLADLPAKRHRVVVNPMHTLLRPTRRLDIQRKKLIMKRRSTEDPKRKRPERRKLDDSDTVDSAQEINEKRSQSESENADEDNIPLKTKENPVMNKNPQTSDAMSGSVMKRPKRKTVQIKDNEINDSAKPLDNLDDSNTVLNEQVPLDSSPQRVDVNNSRFDTREHGNNIGNNNGNNNENNNENNNRRSEERSGHNGQNDNSDNPCTPTHNTPLKHSIALLTANSETHDKSVQFQPLFLMQQECNNVDQHMPSAQPIFFENEVAVTRLDKPPLLYHRETLDHYSTQKSKINKPKKGLNDCIAMLKNKLVDPVPIPTSANQISVQCGSDEPLEPDFPMIGNRLNTGMMLLKEMSLSRQYNNVPKHKYPLWQSTDTHYWNDINQDKVRNIQNSTIQQNTIHSHAASIQRDVQHTVIQDDPHNTQSVTSQYKSHNKIIHQNVTQHPSNIRQTSPIAQPIYVQQKSPNTRPANIEQKSPNEQPVNMLHELTVTQQINMQQRSSNVQQSNQPKSFNTQTGNFQLNSYNAQHAIVSHYSTNVQPGLIKQKSLNAQTANARQKLADTQLVNLQQRSSKAQAGNARKRSFDDQQAKMQKKLTISQPGNVRQKSPDAKLVNVEQKPPSVQISSFQEKLLNVQPAKIRQKSPKANALAIQNTLIKAQSAFFQETERKCGLDQKLVQGKNKRQSSRSRAAKGESVSPNNKQSNKSQFDIMLQKPEYSSSKISTSKQSSKVILPSDYDKAMTTLNLNIVSNIADKDQVLHTISPTGKNIAAQQKVIDGTPNRTIVSNIANTPPLEYIEIYNQSRSEFQSDSIQMKDANSLSVVGFSNRVAMDDCFESNYIGVFPNIPMAHASTNVESIILTPLDLSGKIITNNMLQNTLTENTLAINYENYETLDLSNKYADKDVNVEKLRGDFTSANDTVVDLRIKSSEICCEPTIDLSFKSSIYDNDATDLSLKGTENDYIPTDLSLRGKNKNTTEDVSVNSVQNLSYVHNLSAQTNDIKNFTQEPVSTIDVESFTPEQVSTIDVDYESPTDLSGKAAKENIDTLTSEILLKAVDYKIDNGIGPEDLSKKCEKTCVSRNPEDLENMPQNKFEDFSQDTECKIITEENTSKLEEQAVLSDTDNQQLIQNSLYEEHTLMIPEYKIRTTNTATSIKVSPSTSLSKQPELSETHKTEFIQKNIYSNPTVTADNIIQDKTSYEAEGTGGVILANTTITGSIPDYTLSKSGISPSSGKYDSTKQVYTLPNACIAITKIETSTSFTLTNTLLSIPGTTIASTTPVYTLAGTTVATPVNYGPIPNFSTEILVKTSIPPLTVAVNTVEENKSLSDYKGMPIGITTRDISRRDIDYESDKDNEIAKKIAMLPKELVKIIETMGVDHRNQLLNVLPQYVSNYNITTNSETSHSLLAAAKTHKQSPTNVLAGFEISPSPLKEVTVLLSKSPNIYEIRSPQTSLNSLSNAPSTFPQEIPPAKYEEIKTSLQNSCSKDVIVIPNSEKDKAYVNRFISTVAKPISTDYRVDLNKIIDLTDDEITAPITDISTEVLKQSRIVMTVQESPSFPEASKLKKPKANDQTASLRAVRIKSPPERLKSLAVDNQMLRKISIDNRQTLNLCLDNEVNKSLDTNKSLAIQQAEVSSTQHYGKNVVSNIKLSLEMATSETSVEKSNCEIIPTLLSPTNEVLDKHGKDDNAYTESPIIKLSLVTSSILTSNIGLNTGDVNQKISRNNDQKNSDISVEIETMDIQRTFDGTDISEKPVYSSTPKQTSNVNTVEVEENYISKSKGESINENSTPEEEDSEDDISLAVIVKQKRDLEKKVTRMNKQISVEVLQSTNMLEDKSSKSTKKIVNTISEKQVPKESIACQTKSDTIIDDTVIVEDNTSFTDTDNDEQLTEKSEVNLEVSNSLKIINNNSEKKYNKKNDLVSLEKVEHLHEKRKNVHFNDSIYNENNSYTQNNESKCLSSTGTGDGNIIENLIETEDSESERKPMDLYQEDSHSKYKNRMPSQEMRINNMDVDKLCDHNTDDSKSAFPEIPIIQKIPQKTPFDTNIDIQNEITNKEHIDRNKLGMNPELIEQRKEIKVGETSIQKSLQKEIIRLDGSSNVLKVKENTGEHDISYSESNESDTDFNLTPGNKIIPMKNDKGTDAEISKTANELTIERIESGIGVRALTPRRRSRRGKSLFVENTASKYGNISCYTELGSEQKTPLTKKQLIFSKLLHDEENLNKSITSQPSKAEGIDIKQNKYATVNCISNQPIEREPKKTESEEIKKSVKRKNTTQSNTKSKKNKSSDCITHNEDSNTELDLEVNSVFKETGKKTDSVKETTSIAAEKADIQNSNCLKKFEALKENRDLEITSNKGLDEKTDSVSEIDNNKAIPKKISNPIEKRKINSITISADSNHSSKPKKSKFNNKNEVSTLEDDKQNHKVDDTTTTKVPLLETRNITCYSMPARRTRSKSVVLKSSRADVYDPYDIDLDDMIENPEPIGKRHNKFSINDVKMSTPKENCTKNKGRSHCSDVKSYIDATKNSVEKDSLSDSDDSSKSDVPLQKYVDEKEKKLKITNKLRNTKYSDTGDDLSNERNSKKNQELKTSRRTLTVCNNVKSANPPNEIEDGRRSEQFLESFGFFSQRKPRKSNLLATKKISETFHIERAVGCSSRKERSPKKTPQNENRKSGNSETKSKAKPSSTKKVYKRGRKKKKSTKIKKGFCKVCKKEFRRPDNCLRHQMTLLHVSKLSEIELKIKTTPVHEEPNYLIAYKQHIDRLKMLTDKMSKRKRKAFPLPSVEEILADVNKTVREQQLTRRCLSRDEALFIDCCELLKESHKTDVPKTDTSLSSNINNLPYHGQTSTSNFNLDEKYDPKSDGDVDSITAKNILESEEVRNLENDLISGLKEAANANSLAAKNIDYQHRMHVTRTDTSDGNNDVFDCSKMNNYSQINYEATEGSSMCKVKKHLEMKDKVYQDALENIDIFEDKFDKIKRKCRSQAAAAKHMQNNIDTNASVKKSDLKKKCDKKKGKKSSKKNYQSTVLTKAALKGFDGIKVSIPTTDMNMSAVVSTAETSTKKRKKTVTKKKRDKKSSESSCKGDNDNLTKDYSTQKKVDVYEFMDNEDAELFEFRASTLMERFKSINNKEVACTSKLNSTVEEPEVSSESGSDGDDFVYMSDNYVCSDDETENSLQSCELTTGKVTGDSKKNLSPLKRKDAGEKNAVMGKIFKHNAVRNEKKSSKFKEPENPKANLDQLFDSLLEDEPNSSMLDDISSPEKNNCKRRNSSVILNKSDNYDTSSAKKYDRSSLSPVKKNIRSPVKFRTPSPVRFEHGISTRRCSSSSSKDYELTTLQKPDKTTKKDDSLSSSSGYEDAISIYGPSTSKIYETMTSRAPKTISVEKQIKTYLKDLGTRITKDYESFLDTLDIPSTSKEDVLLHIKKYHFDEKSKMSPPMVEMDEGDKMFHDPNSDNFDNGLIFDDAGVARQRARRKCTVGKQNVLAESWSSESEPDGGPLRPNSTESIIVGKKRKGRKKEGQQTGGRKSNNRLPSSKKHDDESRVTSGNRITSTSAGINRNMYTKAGSSEVETSEVTETKPEKTAANAISPSTSGIQGTSGSKARPRSIAYYWSEGEDEQEHLQQHGWIVGDSHKKLVTMLAHAKGRKRNNDDKRHLVE